MAETAATETAGQEQADPGAAPLTLEEAAALHGAYRWAELQLFALTGAWAAGPDLPPGVRVLLFEASAQHAAHAARWFERLPVLATVDRDDLTRPLGPVLGPVMQALGEGAPAPSPDPGAPVAPAPSADPGADGASPGPGTRAEAGIRFVAGLAEVVLPALVESYRRHLTRLSAVADEPSRRTVAEVLRAEEAELAAARALLAEAETAGEEAWTGRSIDAIRSLLDRAEDPSGDLVPWSDGRCAW